LWIGVLDGSDQRIAVKFFRTQINSVLERLGARLQYQPYDHVLREDDRERSAFETVVEYIARNPERANLVPPDRYQDYKYTGCLAPGYSDLNPWQEGYWDLFWRIYERLRKDGLVHEA